MNITTDDLNYKAMREKLPYSSSFNGLYYYAKTIEQHIMPRVETDRPWNTIGLRACGGYDRMIVFIHSNSDTAQYVWLNRHKDIVIVSGARQTYEKMKQFGFSVYLPLSCDIDEIRAFGKGIKKDQEACFMGNPWPMYQDEIEKYVPPEVHRFGTMPREKLLPIVAHYKTVYAIGCSAVEARALGCEIKKRSDKYDPSDFPLFDCADAAKCLQRALELTNSKSYVDCTELEEYQQKAPR